MVPEVTMMVVDNSEFMRNGDYPPSRWDVQVDAAGVVLEAKVHTNPENEVGVMTMAGKSPEVLVTRTRDLGQLLAGLHDVSLEGCMHLSTTLNIALLALKHRENKSQRQRILVIIGSPLPESIEELVRLGKKLKKNNVSLDVVSLGEVEVEANETKLTALVDAVNASDTSHYLAVHAGTNTLVSDTLRSSSILTTELGTVSLTGDDVVGQDMDWERAPGLVMALRMPLEEEQAQSRAVGLHRTVDRSGLSSDDPGEVVPTAPEPVPLAGRGSMVPPGAESILGAGAAADDVQEEALVRQARDLAADPPCGSSPSLPPDAPNRGAARVSSPSTPPMGGEAQDDEDEQQTIARAIALSMQREDEDNS